MQKCGLHLFLDCQTSAEDGIELLSVKIPSIQSIRLVRHMVYK